MTWVKLDDQFFANPKVVDLSKEQKLLYLAGLTYCAAQLTDGRITKGALRLICAMVEVDQHEANHLVNCGLWEGALDGWTIHDYLEYNPAASEVKEHRSHVSEVRAEAGRKGMAARWSNNKNGNKPAEIDNKTRSDNNNDHNKKDNKSITPSDSRPTPSPTPEREFNESDNETTAEKTDLVAVLQTFGIGMKVANKIVGQYPAERILRQIEILPRRKPDNPAAMLQVAIRDDLPEPKNKPPPSERASGNGDPGYKPFDPAADFARRKQEGIIAKKKAESKKT